jgi:K+-sensing histidine kinase KdpD
VRAFSIVVAHTDRELADYQRHGTAANGEARPAIMACVPPWAGMEPLIRRSGALAAQLAGDFLVAVVRPSPPPDGLEQVLAGYAELTSQLGGQFAVLEGDPADALSTFARQHHVTEMVLARDAQAQAGRRSVLRDLVRGAGDAEVHLLPRGRSAAAVGTEVRGRATGRPA